VRYIAVPTDQSFIFAALKEVGKQTIMYKCRTFFVEEERISGPRAILPKEVSK